MIKKRSDKKAAPFSGSSSRDRKNGKYALLRGKRDRKRLTRRLWEHLVQLGAVLSSSREERNSSSRRAAAPVEPVRVKFNSQGTTGLAFAVVGLLVSAAVMGLITVRLADQPVSNAKSARLGTAASDGASRGDDPWRRPSESAGKPAGETPTPVTFYKDLTAQDDSGASDCEAPPQSPEDAAEKARDATKPRPRDNVDEPDPKRTSGPIAQTGHGARKSSKRTCPAGESGQTKPSPSASTAPSLKKFAVQVGTFAHPSVAREWAVKWKERGYDVILKPVARPGSGVIYRLYLGSFDAEKEADELIRQLKIKEGVNAFRVALI